MPSLYDTTLRDGSQMEGVNFSITDKIIITKKLADFGIGFIEGGWPGSNPKDEEYFKRIKKEKLAAEIVAFSATCLKHKTPTTDPLLTKVVAAHTRYVTVFGKTWDFHTRKILGISDEVAYQLIGDTIQFLRKKKKRVIFDAEHFFDGYQSNPRFAIECLKVAAKAGAENLTLCDTNGGMLPADITRIIHDVQKEITTPLGIHCHNDGGVAVANSLAAVQAGVTLVQGTMNGFGERTGNADLTTIIPNLQLKLGVNVIPHEKLPQLTFLANFIYEVANLRPIDSKPYVGRLAFTHKGGIHASAVAKFADSYQHITPEDVGNTSRTTISELSGKSNVVAVAARLGFTLKPDDVSTHEILATVKTLENNGYSFEAAEASFALLILRTLQKKYRAPFEVIDYLVVDSRSGERITATVELKVADVVRHYAATGNGPVNALDTALRRCVTRFYPSVANVELTDYKVRIIDSASATGATTRVLIESTDGVERWTTVGCAPDIIAASWQALVDSLEYAIWKQTKKR